MKLVMKLTKGLIMTNDKLIEEAVKRYKDERRSLLERVQVIDVILKEIEEGRL